MGLPQMHACSMHIVVDHGMDYAWSTLIQSTGRILTGGPEQDSAARPSALFMYAPSLAHAL